MKNPFVVEAVVSEATTGTTVRPVSFRPGFGTAHVKTTQTHNGSPQIGSTAPPSRPEQPRQVTSIIQRAHKTLLRQAQLNKRAARIQKKAPAPVKTPAPPSTSAANKVSESLSVRESLSTNYLKDLIRTHDFEGALALFSDPATSFSGPVQVMLGHLANTFKAEQRISLLKAALANPAMESAIRRPGFTLDWLFNRDPQELVACFGRPLRAWSFEQRATDTVLPQLRKIWLFPLDVVYKEDRVKGYEFSGITSIRRFDTEESALYQHQFGMRVTIKDLHNLAD